MNAFWDASVYADERMTNDPEWAASDEGRCVLGLVKRENERLRRTVNCLKCSNPIPYTEGTCPHCGYKEF